MERWQRLRPLLESLVELPAAEREERLASLPPEVAGELRVLLAVEDGGFSQRFDQAVARHASAVVGADASLAGLRLGPWRLELPLGRGGMAEVWQASRDDGQFEQTAVGQAGCREDRAVVGSAHASQHAVFEFV